MSSLIKGDSILVKYNDIHTNIKKKLNIKFHSLTIYDKRCIKTYMRKYKKMYIIIKHCCS